MAQPIPTYFFALVVARLGDRFLLVHERKHGQAWYVPAGRVEPGESLAEAAVRETQEEAGIRVRIDGVVRLEHTPSPEGGARVRAIFAASPLDDTPPKSVPDEESLGAGWFTLEEAARLPLRGREVLDLLRSVASGRAVLPLRALASETDPFVDA